MRRRLFKNGWQCAVVVGLFSCATAAAKEIPFQSSDPETFWTDKMVIQKKGIVVEDEDWIVRRRYWVLDKSVTGRVVAVESVGGQVFLTVEYDGRGPGWVMTGINEQDRTVSNTRRNYRIRPDPYSDGTDVEMDEVTVTHTIQGVQMPPERCGLIVFVEGRAVRVRFPVHLIALEGPRKKALVMRSWDWHDGHADGGDEPEGPLRGPVADRIGEVLMERDDKGFVKVLWHATGREKLHRFDRDGFYDIETVPDR